VPDIFISYDRAQARTARRVVDGLTIAGYDVWWDALVPPHRSERWPDCVDEIRSSYDFKAAVEAQGSAKRSAR
jgi:hypothetical protein